GRLPVAGEVSAGGADDLPAGGGAQVGQRPAGQGRGGRGRGIAGEQGPGLRGGGGGGGPALAGPGPAGAAGAPRQGLPSRPPLWPAGPEGAPPPRRSPRAASASAITRR